MANPAKVLTTSTPQQPPPPQPLTAAGIIVDAPAALDDTCTVLIPTFSTSHTYGPCEFVCGQGLTLPAPGAACLVVFDNASIPYVVWFAGAFSEEAEPTIPPIPPFSHYDALQAGVIGGGDAGLTQTGGTSVSIAAGTVLVPSAAGILVRQTPALTAFSTAYAAATFNRLDCVVADSSGNYDYLMGTPQAGAGATLANRSGAPAIPAGSQLLHDLLVGSSGTPAWRDRRPWARGYHNSLLEASGVSTGSNATWEIIDAVHLAQRVEVGASGLLRCRFQTGLTFASGGVYGYLGFAIDGAFPLTPYPFNGTNAAAGYFLFNSVAGGGSYDDQQFSITDTIAVAPGSHLIQAAWCQSYSGGSTLGLRASNELEVEELLRTNTNNGTS